MKQWNQSKEQIENLIKYAQENDEPLYIVSGEGEVGTNEEYDGAMTARAIMSRLTKERCGGDRWARVDTCDDRVLAGVM